MARHRGWVPGQHGAWAMLLLPFLVGTVRGGQDFGLSVVWIPLLATWLVGYFAFWAVGLWLKSRRRPQYVKPSVTYLAVTAVMGLVTVALCPGLIWWAFAFAPFLVVGLMAAASRTERTVLAGGALTAAASVMTVVAYHAQSLSAGVSAPWPSPIWWVAVQMFGYLCGTVLYVKSMIRGRGIRGYAVASVVFHAAMLAVMLGLAVGIESSWWWAVAVFALLLARAWWMVGRVITPKMLGIGEMVASVMVAVSGVMAG